jgi:hypothetical protein
VSSAIHGVALADGGSLALFGSGGGLLLGLFCVDKGGGPLRLSGSSLLLVHSVVIRAIGSRIDKGGGRCPNHGGCSGRSPAHRVGAQPKGALGQRKVNRGENPDSCTMKANMARENNRLIMERQSSCTYIGKEVLGGL